MTEEIQVYFELDKKNFTLDTARFAVKAWIDKYNLREVNVETEAAKLYNGGNGGGILFINLPYNALIIEAQSNKRYRRIPPDRLYVYMSCDRTNFKNQTHIEQYVDDAVALYFALKAKLGVGGIEDFFENDGTHFLRELSVYPLMLFGPALVRAIRAEKFSTLEGKVYEVRTLDDGGIMIRLSKESPMRRGTTELEAFVAKQLGIKS